MILQACESTLYSNFYKSYDQFFDGFPSSQEATGFSSFMSKSIYRDLLQRDNPSQSMITLSMISIYKSVALVFDCN